MKKSYSNLIKDYKPKKEVFTYHKRCTYGNRDARRKKRLTCDKKTCNIWLTRAEHDYDCIKFGCFYKKES